jgi:hypothetical protein
VFLSPTNGMRRLSMSRTLASILSRKAMVYFYIKSSIALGAGLTSTIL